MRLYILFFLNIFLFSSVSLSSENKIILGLDWFINPDHAPIVIADKYGYFSDEDLKVKIIEPADPNDPPKQVAAGKIDGFWERDLNLWDICSGVLLVKEAGGKISDPNGDKWTTKSRDITASNSLIHDKLIENLTLL